MTLTELRHFDRVLASYRIWIDALCARNRERNHRRRKVPETISPELKARIRARFAAADPDRIVAGIPRSLR
jgi:hypothetical protein